MSGEAVLWWETTGGYHELVECDVEWSMDEWMLAGGADAGHGLKDCNVDSVQWVDGVFPGTRVSGGGAGGPARRRASWRGARWSGL